MKLYILNTGYLISKDTALVAPDPNEHVQPKEIHFPVLAFLIDHPTAGKILYDVGSHIGAMDGYWPEHVRKAFPLIETPETNLVNQLALCGTTPNEIKTVILSHLHIDHAGNMDLFPHAEVYAPKKDYELCSALLNASDNPVDHGFYVKKDIDSIAKEHLHLIDADTELFPRIEAIQLPGHTPDLLGLVVHLENETLILPQDCVYTSKNFGPPAKRSSIVFDESDFFASIEKVRMLSEKYNARIIWAHDVDVFSSFHAAPHYYE